MAYFGPFQHSLASFIGSFWPILAYFAHCRFLALFGSVWSISFFLSDQAARRQAQVEHDLQAGCVLTPVQAFRGAVFMWNTSLTSVFVSLFRSLFVKSAC